MKWSLDQPYPINQGPIYKITSKMLIIKILCEKLQHFLGAYINVAILFQSARDETMIVALKVESSTQFYVKIEVSRLLGENKKIKRKKTKDSYETVTKVDYHCFWRTIKIFIKQWKVQT